MLFGEKLVILRKKHGLSQRDLAKSLNLSHGSIGKYERNSAEPDFATLRAISKLFSVSIDYLLDVSDEENFEIDIYKITPNQIDRDELVELIKSYADCSQLNRDRIRGILAELAQRK